MLMKFLIAGLFMLYSSEVCSQNNFEKEITAGDYKIFLTNSEDDFFTGSIQIADKYNNTVFYADSAYTRYNWDTLIDLNNDGSKEFILDLGTGATMYDYNMYLIFDFTKNPGEPLEVHNANLMANVDDLPKIVSYVRLSPAALGAGYSFSLKYNDGKLILENNINDSKVLKGLETDDKEDLHLIEEYTKAFNECDNASEIKTYFEAYIMQQKILNQEEKGWKFFDKYYKCRDKREARATLKKITQEDYDFWYNSEYKFGGEGNY
jgi:hypothetical protein